MGSNLKGFGICMIKGQSKQAAMVYAWWPALVGLRGARARPRGHASRPLRPRLSKVILHADINMDPRAMVVAWLVNIYFLPTKLSGS